MRMKSSESDEITQMLFVFILDFTQTYATDSSLSLQPYSYQTIESYHLKMTYNHRKDIDNPCNERYTDSNGTASIGILFQ